MMKKISQILIHTRLLIVDSSCGLTSGAARATSHDNLRRPLSEHFCSNGGHSAVATSEKNKVLRMVEGLAALVGRQSFGFHKFIEDYSNKRFL